jgi:hypothetical protein
MAGRVIDPDVVAYFVTVTGGKITLLVNQIMPKVFPDSVEPIHSWFHISIAVVVTGGGVMVVVTGAPLTVIAVGQCSSRVMVADRFQELQIIWPVVGTAWWNAGDIWSA